jgi:hypothetical protein
MRRTVEKKMRFYLLIGILILPAACSQIKAQKTIEYGYYAAKKTGEKEVKAVNLTKEIYKKCDRSLTGKVGNSFIELRFPSEFSGEATNVFTALENSVGETQKILTPLPVENLRFYLLQLDEIPASYKIIDKVEKLDFYLHLWVFKDKRELNLSCDKKDKLCESIYGTIPHELTHGAVENLISHKDTKWFEEGLSVYLGEKVSDIFRPLVSQDRFNKNIPKVTLHRQDIRDSLFSWKHETFDSIEKRDNLTARNQWFRYIASGYLIKLMVENSEREGVKDPLKVLVESLIKFRKEEKSSAKSGEILSIIRENLTVNLKTLGVLGETERNNLADDAFKILAKTNLNDEDKNYVFIILASIDEIAIPPNLLIELLNEFFSRDKNLRSLAATILARRTNQENFDAAVKAFIKANANLNLDRNKIKDAIEKVSFRPPIK